jgi:hypothetical protein
MAGGNSRHGPRKARVVRCRLLRGCQLWWNLRFCIPGEVVRNPIATWSQARRHPPLPSVVRLHRRCMSATSLNPLRLRNECMCVVAGTLPTRDVYIRLRARWWPFRACAFPVPPRRKLPPPPSVLAGPTRRRRDILLARSVRLRRKWLSPPIPQVRCLSCRSSDAWSKSFRWECIRCGCVSRAVR